MKGWETNAQEFWNSENAGICPKCGSRDIHAEKHIGKRRKSVSFLCRSCGSSDHFDGIIDEKKNV